MFGRSIDQMACIFNDSSSANKMQKKAQSLRFSAFSDFYFFFPANHSRKIIFYGNRSVADCLYNLQWRLPYDYRFFGSVGTDISNVRGIFLGAALLKCQHRCGSNAPTEARFHVGQIGDLQLPVPVTLNNEKAWLKALY
jgi:hypothetical protein